MVDFCFLVDIFANFVDAVVYNELLKNRSEVKKEFKFYLPEDFKAKDPKMFALITVSNTLEGKFLLFRVDC